MDKLKNIIKSYELWVANNPETVSDVETTTKWISYFVAGRISDSNVLSELIYSLSNMLVLYNDRIIDRARGIKEASMQNNEKSPGICYRIKVILTTLEYSEVFIEISAKRVFGNKGKWIIICLLQLMKAAGRFFILKHSTEQIISSPAMPILNRRALLQKQKNNDTNSSLAQPQNSFESSITFRLKRSGRVVRKVEGASPMHYRNLTQYNDLLQSESKQKTLNILLQAEYLYIAKPLIHLAAMGVFGERCWKQYVVSLSIDLISIRLYHKNRAAMSKEQKLEMSRRCINLLMYLMRSPFYDNFTQTRLERILDFLATRVPIVKMVAGPLRDYIPHWQNTYYYLWST